MAENNNMNEKVTSEGGMESMNRVAKLPIVESTVNMASGFYNKVKDSNEMVHSVLTRAESTVKQAVDMSKPMTDKFEAPLKKVDSLLCSGLDYVETNVPAIKLPPQEMYETTKNAVVSSVEPAIKSVSSMAGQGMQKVSSTVSSTFSQNCTSCAEAKCCLHKDQPCPKADGT